MLKHLNLIAGQWLAGTSEFTNQPVSGTPDRFSECTVELVNQAVVAAQEAFWTFGYSSRAQRAKFLRTIADEIDNRGDQITEIGTRETGLPDARLTGERGRTVGQLRLFADHIEAGDYLDRRHDVALPDRQPLARPDLRMMQRPVGPVGVFGASNFPLAFSTAGGDTAAALAAGCPVVVRGHFAHPGTADIVAQAIDIAIKKCDVPAGVFSLIQGSDRAVGQAIVQHPMIKAVGFTGSLAGGRALFDLCAARPEPIPFFGELGSVNPMFLLPHALSARGQDIANGWAGSLTTGAGQFCTNPGLAILVKSAAADVFKSAASDALSKIETQTMLTQGIADAFHAGRDRFAETDGVRQLVTSQCDLRNAAPYLFETSARAWLNNAELGEEVFGPLGMIVTADSDDEMYEVARALQGQLTCTLQMDAQDTELARRLLPVLEQKAGRILANGYPTGVEVSDAMVHGGPYPASTNFGATSVGTLSIRRFLRPVCYQNLPESILPSDLV